MDGLIKDQSKRSCYCDWEKVEGLDSINGPFPIKKLGSDEKNSLVYVFRAVHFLISKSATFLEPSPSTFKLFNSAAYNAWKYGAIVKSLDFRSYR